MKKTKISQLPTRLQIRTPEQGTILVKEMLKDAQLYHHILDNYDALMVTKKSGFNRDHLIILSACYRVRLNFGLDPSRPTFRNRLEVFVVSEVLPYYEECDPLQLLDEYLGHSNHSNQVVERAHNVQACVADANHLPIVRQKRFKTNVYHFDKGSTQFVGLNVIGFPNCDAQLAFSIELAIGVVRHFEENDCIVIFTTYYSQEDIFTAILSNLSGVGWPDSEDSHEILKSSEACVAFEKGLAVLRLWRLNERVRVWNSRTESKPIPFVLDAKRSAGASRALILMDACTKGSGSLDKDLVSYGKDIQYAQRVVDSEDGNIVLLSYYTEEINDPRVALAWEVFVHAVTNEGVDSFFIAECTGRQDVGSSCPPFNSSSPRDEMANGRKLIGDASVSSLAMREVGSNGSILQEPMLFEYDKQLSSLYSVVRSSR